LIVFQAKSKRTHQNALLVYLKDNEIYVVIKDDHGAEVGHMKYLLAEEDMQWVQFGLLKATDHLVLTVAGHRVRMMGYPSRLHFGTHLVIGSLPAKLARRYHAESIDHLNGCAKDLIINGHLVDFGSSDHDDSNLAPCLEPAQTGTNFEADSHLTVEVAAEEAVSSLSFDFNSNSSSAHLLSLKDADKGHLSMILHKDKVLLPIAHLLYVQQISLPVHFQILITYSDTRGQTTVLEEGSITFCQGSWSQVKIELSRLSTNFQLGGLSFTASKQLDRIEALQFGKVDGSA
jgi:hypothetical protein